MIQYSLLGRTAASIRLNTTFRGLDPSPSSGKTDQFCLTILNLISSLVRTATGSGKVILITKINVQSECFPKMSVMISGCTFDLVQ
jgi:hypothetical protein